MGGGWNVTQIDQNRLNGYLFNRLHESHPCNDERLHSTWCKKFVLLRNLMWWLKRSLAPHWSGTWECGSGWARRCIFNLADRWARDLCKNINRAKRWAGLFCSQCRQRDGSYVIGRWHKRVGFWPCAWCHSLNASSICWIFKGYLFLYITTNVILTV